MMSTTTSYHPAGFQTTSTSASYKEQQNVANYGYGNGNFHYPTTPTATAAAAATTIGYGGSTQNTHGPCQPTFVSNIQPNPPSPQFYSYPPYSSQPESRQASSYSSMPIPNTRPQSLVAEPPTRVHSMTDNVKQVDCNTSDAGTNEKKKRRWSLYGRSKNEMHAETEATEGVDGGSSNHKHVKAQRRWSLNSRSKNKTEAETTPAVNISGNSSSKNGDESNNNGSQKAQRRWSFYSNSKKEANNESTTDARSSVKPANDLLVVYQLPKNAGSESQQQPGASNYRPAEVHPEKHAMKQDRKAKMAGAATTGAIVGAVLTGPAWPVGAMAGAAIGSYAGKVTARAGERRQQRRWEQKTFNEYLAKGQAGVQREGVVLV